MKIGFATGTWDSEIVRDPRRRRIIEKIDTGGPARERLQLARKVLRDGSDVTRTMLFEIFLREQMDTRWGTENPFEPALGAMRVVRRDRARWRGLAEQVAAAVATSTHARSTLRAALDEGP